MQLSEDTFQKIAASIAIADPADPAEAAHAEALADGTRANPRLPASTHVTVYNWDEAAEPNGVRIRDLSPGGLGILHADRMPLDQHLVVRLPIESDSGELSDQQPQERSVLVLATVVYWEPLALNLFAVGLQFVRQLSESDLTDRLLELSAETQTRVGVLARITHVLTRGRRVAS